MFISKEEKQRIEAKLDAARHHIVLLESRITLLENNLKQLESKPVKVKKAKKPMTAAQKAKQRAYQKAYNERQKAKKLAEGNTNVSA